ncbi:hypothetical protein OIU77_014424 [Salix suchowensis]|uniref:Protein kinase domain-containing protein n=1 Tax=Salix suchowensis TaxID=1278906 RepID=A0ABQ8ZX78_9ROSI|nr:hypothetical protein OIU77_014424 [Salix suchowensis]
MLPWNPALSPRSQPCTASNTTQTFSKSTRLWQRKPRFTSSWNLPREAIFSLRSGRWANLKNQPHVVTFNNLCLPSTSAIKMESLTASALKNGGVDVGFLLQTACGTPAFTAPEVMARRGYDGSKADAWSCGVILFFFLSASLPFNDSNLAVMYRKIHKGEYQLPSCLKKPVKSIINQLLDPNPNKRMSIEALMNHPWFLKGFEIPAKSSVLEIVEKLLVVEIKVVEGGGVEFGDLHWGELKDGLEDVVLQWHDDVM